MPASAATIFAAAHDSGDAAMTATPALRQADVPTLAHWIGGKRTPGTSGRFGDVYTPATGALGARVPFATAAEVASRGRRREGRLSRLGGDDAARPRPRHVPLQGAARAARRRDRRGDLARARQGAVAMRRASSRAASTSSNTRAARRSSSRANSPRTSAPASTRTRCASRSASSPASRRSTSRRWCRCGCFRWRSSAATRSC